jgi:hypothetical protein
MSGAEDGYRLAQKLWSARYRPSGKPFVDHLIGTSSALAFDGQARPVVLAGLLHAAYESGDFGPNHRASAERNRSMVRVAIGEEAEQLVHAYTTFAWWPEGVARLSVEPPTSPVEVELVAMRIANEWDDWVDGGVLRSGKRHAAEHQVPAASQMVSLARRHGLDLLGSGLEQAVRMSLDADLPQHSSNGMPDRSVLLLPASAKAQVALAERARRWALRVPCTRRIARVARRFT